MAYVETSPLDTVAAIRERVLEGLAPVEDFAAAIDKTTRTMSNYIRQGLPVTYIGPSPFVRIDAARDWLRARKTCDLEPRGRGRPRKNP
jgi:hypothetical protein